MPPLRVRIPPVAGCGCLFAGVATPIVAFRFWGWAGLLVLFVISIVLGMVATWYVKWWFRRKLQQIVDEVQAESGLPPGGAPATPKHALWVCGGCGDSNPGNRPTCQSCGRDA